MRISAVDAFPLRAPLEQPFAFSQFRYTHREAMLVRIQTDEGLEGWGEAYGPAALTAPPVTHLFTPLLVGRDPRDVEALWSLLYARSFDYGQKGLMLAAISAIDIACWDLKAQAAGVPLYRLLGGEEVESIPCYATGFYFRDGRPLVEQVEQEARQRLDEGFRAVKLKVGRGVEADAELVRHIRSVIGPDAKLLIDANHAFTPREAIALARRLADCDIFWFEEPVSALDIDAYLEVKRAAPMPLAGGEVEATRFGFEPWLRRRAYDFAQPDMNACGGITEAMKIATLASLTAIHVTPHAWGTAVAQAAALHFYAARPRQPFTTTPEAKLIERDMSEHPLRDSLVDRPLEFAEGCWRLPAEPGLGLRVAAETLERYRLPGS